MGVLRDRLDTADGPPRLRSSDRTAQELVDLYETKIAVLPRAQSLPWAPIDLVAALGAFALGEEGEPGPSLIQTEPRSPRLAHAIAEPAVARLFPGAPRPAVLALSAGLLQISDFWEMSHEAAQQADDLGDAGSAAYWHGIAHRREPDAGNASYWFRRVGLHSIFSALAQTAQHWLDAEGDTSLARRLIPEGAWNPSAMIDLCVKARLGTREEKLARRLQREEMWLLLEASFEAVTGSGGQ